MDIGDKVKKGEMLATLFVPELVEDFGTKKATVELDQERIELARKVVKVAEADVKAAEARLEEAKAILDKYEAEVERWDSEVKRLTERGRPRRGRSPGSARVDQPVEVEHRLARAAKATIIEGGGRLLSERPRSPRPRSTSRSPRPILAVAESEAKRLEAWVGYLKLTAPFDGVIVARNANTFDFVLPSTGDPTGHASDPHLSPRAVPRRSMWSIAPTSSGSSSTSPSRTPTTSTSAPRRPCSPRRTAISRFPGSVTRTSWALNVKSRTLRAEIDLPNPNSQLLPGMYAYAKVIIERPDVAGVAGGRAHP